MDLLLPLSSMAGVIGVASAMNGGCSNPEAKGARCQQGPPGPAGAKGPVGDRGPRGDQGVPGRAGLQGPHGAEGCRGERGHVGPMGPEGEQGHTGPQGEQGHTGPQGEQGHTGPQGEQGPTGQQGVQGERGERGETGPDGEKGSKIKCIEINEYASSCQCLDLKAVGVTGQDLFDTEHSIMFEWDGENWQVKESQPLAPYHVFCEDDCSLWFVDERKDCTQAVECVGRPCDYTFDKLTQNLYEWKQDGWKLCSNFKGDTGPTGDMGATGDAGATGQKGTQFSCIDVDYSGYVFDLGLQALSPQEVGQPFALNLVDCKLYQWNPEDNEWCVQSDDTFSYQETLSLGFGFSGTRFFNVTAGDCECLEGCNPGDMLLHEETGDIYSYDGECVWNLTSCNLMGPTGPSGLEGEAGATGIDGKDGSMWFCKEVDYEGYVFDDSNAMMVVTPDAENTCYALVLETCEFYQWYNDCWKLQSFENGTYCYQETRFAPGAIVVAGSSRFFSVDVDDNDLNTCLCFQGSNAGDFLLLENSGQVYSYVGNESCLWMVTDCNLRGPAGSQIKCFPFLVACLYDNAGQLTGSGAPANDDDLAFDCEVSTFYEWDGDSWDPVNDQPYQNDQKDQVVFQVLDKLTCKMYDINPEAPCTEFTECDLGDYVFNKDAESDNLLSVYKLEEDGFKLCAQIDQHDDLRSALELLDIKLQQIELNIGALETEVDENKILLDNTVTAVTDGDGLLQVAIDALDLKVDDNKSLVVTAQGEVVDLKANVTDLLNATVLLSNNDATLAATASALQGDLLKLDTKVGDADTLLQANIDALQNDIVNVQIPSAITALNPAGIAAAIASSQTNTNDIDSLSATLANLITALNVAIVGLTYVATPALP